MSEDRTFCDWFNKQNDLDVKIFHTSVVRLILEFCFVYCDWFEIFDVTETFIKLSTD